MIAEDCGRLFEYAVVRALLHDLQSHPDAVVCPALEGYQADLAALDHAALLERFCTRQQAVVSGVDRGILRRHAERLLWAGFAGGLSVFGAFRRALEEGAPGRGPTQIVYCQCLLRGDNSFGLLERETNRERRALLEQLGLPPTVDLAAYGAVGGFLNADCLLLARRGRHWRLLALDASVFSVREIRDLRDLGQIAEIERALRAEIAYVAHKSYFARLNLDTGADQTLDLSGALAAYLPAFLRPDKEPYKLAQAASYAASFYDFLSAHALLPPAERFLINVVGYSDRTMASACVRPEQIGLLRVAGDLYRHSKVVAPDYETARALVSSKVQRTVARSFASYEEGRNVVARIMAQASSPDPGVVTYEEEITDFCPMNAPLPPEVWQACGLPGPCTVREGHAALVHAALEGSSPLERRPFLFLLGCPGIGKTTAIIAWFLSLLRGGLLFYANPRKQLSGDVLDKCVDAGALALPDFMGLTTNKVLISDTGGGMAVHYLASAQHGHFQARGVQFFDQREPLGEYERTRRRRLHAVSAEKLRDRGATEAGVLYSLCHAIPAALEAGARRLVATVALQSHKVHRDDSDTLRHLEVLFRSCYNERHGEVIGEKMRALARQIPHLVFMIDEVTGDSAGADFLRRVVEIVSKYDLPRYGFDVKIIVADASIVDPAVIRRLLDPERTAPQSDKFYVRTLGPQDGALLAPLAVLPFSYRAPDDAWVINANAYPASRLRGRYRVCLDRQEDAGGVPLHQRAAEAAVARALNSQVDAVLAQDLLEILEPMAPGEDQVLVYIQDKGRLERVKEVVRADLEERGQSFDEGPDYVQIHADLAPEQRATVREHRTGVRVVFMTSSASRGLSFPLAHHLLIDVARFMPERNLAEIVQMFYRARGGTAEDEPKDVTFYISDRLVPGGEGESVLGTLGLLFLLKSAVQTRLCGAGRVREDRISVIPLGGTSASTATHAFHATAADFVRALCRAQAGHWSDPHLARAAELVQRLFGRLDVSLEKHEAASYLGLRDAYSPAALLEWLGRGPGGLGARPPLEDAYVLGSLLVVPVSRRVSFEHKMSLAHDIEPYLGHAQIGSVLHLMQHPEKYPTPVVDGAKSFMALVNELQGLLERGPGGGESQTLEHVSQPLRGYYVLPLAAFTCKDVFSVHFGQTKRPLAEDLRWRELLEQAVRQYCTPLVVLPIAGRYGADGPWIYIETYDLAPRQAQAFTEGMLLMSTEMNLLNMLLAQD